MGCYCTDYFRSMQMTPNFHVAILQFCVELDLCYTSYIVFGLFFFYFRKQFSLFLNGCTFMIPEINFAIVCCKTVEGSKKNFKITAGGCSLLTILFICTFNVFNFLEKSTGIKILFVIAVYIKKSPVYEHIRYLQGP